MRLRVLRGIAAIRADKHHPRAAEGVVRDGRHAIGDHQVEALGHPGEGLGFDGGQVGGEGEGDGFQGIVDDIGYTMRHGKAQCR